MSEKSEQNEIQKEPAEVEKALNSSGAGGVEKKETIKEPRNYQTSRSEEDLHANRMAKQRKEEREKQKAEEKKKATIEEPRQFRSTPDPDIFPPPLPSDLFVFVPPPVRPWQRDSAKNALESYCFNIKQTIEDEKLKDKISEEDRKQVLDKCKEILAWLDANQTAEKEEFEHHQKELESVCNPIMTKLYSATGGAPGGMPGASGMHGAGAAGGGAPGGPTK